MHEFDTELAPQGCGHYDCLLSNRFAINYTPNGGYIMGLLTRAMAGEAGLDPQTAIVTANYLDRCDEKTARIVVTTLGESGSFLRQQASLVQSGRERIRAMATFVKPVEGQIPADYAIGPESVSPMAACIQIPPMPGYSLYESIDLRLDPESAGWMTGTPGGQAVMKGWIGFKAERRIDLPALTLFADAFPPAVFASRGMVAWVPTIEYSVNVRQLPAGSAIKGIFTTRFLSAGLVEEDGELWDDAGNLLALSRQIAKYRPAEAQT